MVVFDNVSKTYGGNDKHIALQNVSFHVEKGDFAFLIGKTGAGKSTILKLILREEDVTSGRVLVAGNDVSAIRRSRLPYYRRGIGVVFQDFRLIPSMNVYDNVAFVLRVTNVSNRDIKRRVPYVLDLVGLLDKAKRFPEHLSGGEQQRVALARAILKNAPIVVLDEATAFADPENEALIQKAFAALTKGRTVIMIAHSLSTVVGADKIIVLDSGRVAEEGTHAQLAAAGGLYAKMWTDYNKAVKWRI